MRDLRYFRMGRAMNRALKSAIAFSRLAGGGVESARQYFEGERFSDAPFTSSFDR